MKANRFESVLNPNHCRKLTTSNSLGVICAQSIFGLGDAFSPMAFALNLVRNSSHHSDWLGYQLWHRPLKMASLVYERETRSALANWHELQFTKENLSVILLYSGFCSSDSPAFFSFPISTLLCVPLLLRILINSNQFSDKVTTEGRHFCFLFRVYISWTSHGLSSSCHPTAQLARGHKTLGSQLN